MEYDDIVYISEELGNSLSRTQVSTGDIVISQRGTLGQCAVVDDTFDKLNISANIIAIKNVRGLSSAFIRDYILSNIGQTLLERNMSGQVQKKVTTQDIADLLVPLNCAETKLSAIMENAHTRYVQKIQQAATVLVQAKEQVFTSIGISFGDYRPSIFNFQKLNSVLGCGIYCNAHSAYLNTLFEHLRCNKWYAGHLDEFVDINPGTDRSTLAEDTPVTFVPMTAVEEKANHVEYESRKYSEVRTGFTIFQRGDMLWAKITPCMQNGKSFLASDMPTEIGFASTEFHVLRKKSDRIYMPYLWVILSENHVLEAAQGMFSGSAGQQRVPDAFLKKFPIVLPPIEVQRELAGNVFAALQRAKEMRAAAEQEWQTAKAEFEKELLGE